MRPPSVVYFFGFFRNSTISFSSCSASSTPATSAKLTFTSSSAKTRCLLRANDITPPSAPLMRRKKKLQTPNSSSSGTIQPRISGSQRLTNSPVYFTPAASRSSSSFGSSMRVGVERAAAVGLALVRAADGLLADEDLGDLAGADRLLELAVRDLASRRASGTTPARAPCSNRNPRTYQTAPPGRPASERAAVAGPFVARIHARWGSEIRPFGPAYAASLSASLLL